MGADITIKQTNKGVTNDLEFNKIKEFPGTVTMHARTIKHYGLLSEKIIGNDENCSHYEGDIDIPDQVQGKDGQIYQVIQLGTPKEPVMQQATKLEMVSIPGTVKSILPFSFAGCIRLVSVALGEGIEVIEEKAFWYCNLLLLYLPDSMKDISRAFVYNPILERVEIGSGMVRMNGAFSLCPEIKTVICKAENPPEIDEDTFDSDVYWKAFLQVPYSALEKYKNHPLWGKFRDISEIPDTIPPEVQEERTFYQTIDGIRYFKNIGYMRAEVVAPADGSRYEQKEVVILDKVDDIFPVTRIADWAFADAATTSIKLPNTIETIGARAFEGTNLTGITLPNSLTKIEDSTFLGCSSLKRIDIPGKVTRIGDDAFEGCTKLESVTLHPGLKEIGACAFTDNFELKEITIPATVSTIGRNAFTGSGLKRVTCEGSTPPANVDSKAFDADTLQNALLRVPASAVSTYKAHGVWGLFSKIEGIGSSGSSSGSSSSGSSSGSSSVSKYAGSTLYSGGQTFMVDGICYEIKNINAKVVHVHKLPDDKKYSGRVVIPSSVNYNGVKYDVKAVNDEAFYWSDVLSVNISGNVEIVGKKAFSDCRKMENLSLHDGLVKIDENAFHNLFELQSLKIPDTVREIGRSAFSQCCLTDNYSDLIIPDSVVSLGMSAFSFYGRYRRVTLSAGVTRLERDLFFNSRMKELVIPASVTSIGHEALVSSKTRWRKSPARP